MQTLRVSICVFIGLLVAGPVVKATRTACGFDLEARAAATRVLVGEPILIQVVLKNQTSASAEIIPAPRRPFHIEFSRDGQTYEGFWAYERILTGPWRGPVLKPGEELRRRELLVRNVRNVLKPPVAYDYPLFERGIGHIRVGVELRVDGERKAIVSEPIRVEVSEPVGANREVWERVRQQHWWAPLLQQIGLVDSDVSVEAQIEQLLKEYASTVYVHHLALALGRYYQRRAYQIPLGGGDAERAKYLQRAREYFELAARMEQVPWVREEAMLELAKLKGGAEAIRICDEALQRWPDSFLREEFQRLRTAWQKELELEAMFKPTEDGGLRAERELKAMGYDLDNLTEAERRILAYEIEGGTLKECEQRQLSNEECDELLYRRYMDWVMKNLKPVRPPQTNEVGGVTVPLE